MTKQEARTLLDLARAGGNVDSSAILEALGVTGDLSTQTPTKPEFGVHPAWEPTKTK